jgi:hypothetical protein
LYSEFKKPRDFTRLTQTFLQAKSFTKKPICFSFSTGFLFVTLTPHHLGNMSHRIPPNIQPFDDQTLNGTDAFIFSYPVYREYVSAVKKQL